MPESARSISVTRPGGRSLEVLLQGRAKDRPLLFHGGTPSAAVAYTPMADAATRAGLQLITYSRPGYASSTAQPGRSIVDAAADVAAILDAIGAERFVTAGWSGGGPHALACVTALRDRCLAAATIAGVAPYPAQGLDWMADMGPENVDEFSAAIAGTETLSPMLERFAADLADVQGDQVAESLGGLVSEVDKASLTGAFADYLAMSFRRSVSAGIGGWRDDDLAFTRPWGFDLATIDRPVAIWQGDQDRMVPFAHGAWLAAHLPGARVHLSPGQGHLSLAVGSFERIVLDLASLAGD
ncbi:MAG: alpha/beta fold hydrolase [Candidatus Dormibacter sp.]